MTDSLLALLVTAAVTVLAIAYMLIGYSARASARFIVRGLGLIALAVGLWMTGWMQLTINGVRSIIDWFQRTAPSTLLYVGAGVGAVGALMLLAGGLIRVPTRSEARMARSDRELRSRERDRRRAGSTTVAPAGESPSYTSPSYTSSSEAEMTKILNKHGI